MWKCCKFTYLIVSVEIGRASLSRANWCRTVGMAAISCESDFDTAWLVRDRFGIDVVTWGGGVSIIEMENIIAIDLPPLSPVAQAQNSLSPF